MILTWVFDTRLDVHFHKIPASACGLASFPRKRNPGPSAMGLDAAARHDILLDRTSKWTSSPRKGVEPVAITGVFRAYAARENPCCTKRQRTLHCLWGKLWGDGLLQAESGCQRSASWRPVSP